MNVKTHPLAEIVAKKLSGIGGVPRLEQYVMVDRAVKAAVEYHEKEQGKSQWEVRQLTEENESLRERLVELAHVVEDNWQEAGDWGHCNYCYCNQPASMHRLTRDEQVHDDDCPVHLAREVIEEYNHE